MLHLPFSALEDDLERMRKEAQRKAAYSYKAKRERGTPASPRKPARKQLEPPAEEWGPPADEAVPMAEDQWVPMDEGGGDELVAMDDLPESGQEEMLPAPPPEPPPHTEYLLCEQLMECEHDETVLALVRTYLPLELITHAFARGFVSTLLSSGGDDDALPSYCAAADEAWQPLIGQLIVNKQKMLSARESTPADAVKDLITALWIAHLKHKRGQLNAESTPENDAERFRLTFLIKAFETQTWDKISRLILK